MYLTEKAKRLKKLVLTHVSELLNLVLRKMKTLGWNVTLLIPSELNQKQSETVIKPSKFYIPDLEHEHC
jgi:hypothetical protein